MDSYGDKQWASKYLLDPLNEPQPGEETGPGAHFRSTFAPITTPSEVSSIAPSKKPSQSDRKAPSEINVESKPARPTSVRDVSFRKMSSNKKDPYPTPPHSASPRRDTFSRQEVPDRSISNVTSSPKQFNNARDSPKQPNSSRDSHNRQAIPNRPTSNSVGSRQDITYRPSSNTATSPRSPTNLRENIPRQAISGRPSSNSVSSSNRPSVSSINSPGSNNPYRQEAFGSSNPGTSGGRRRGNSLGERYNGDKSHRPLDMIKKDQKAAHRAPHLRKKHQIGIDVIDNLDNVGGKYHHEGPFDATYFTRNTSFNSSPLEALSWSNEEALKATPKERILDSVKGRRPLDGVATYPPGSIDENGRSYNYKEGGNMMIEDGGDYKRMPGVKYLDEDIKGKGEPSYTIEKALKSQNAATAASHRRVVSNDIEMTSRPRTSSGKPDQQVPESMWDDGERSGGLRRSSTTGGKLRRRLGIGHRDSLRERGSMDA